MPKPRAASKKGKGAAAKSKASEVRKRNGRIDDLYENRGYRPPEIADILIDEGFGTPAGRASLLRLVQARVMEIRGEAPADALLKRHRPAEAQRARRQLYKLLRDAQDIIECDDEVERQVVTPKGDVITVNEPRYPPAEKNKAIKTAASLVEKIALLNSVDIKTGLTEATHGGADPDKPAATAKRFTFNLSGRSLDSLIAERSGTGTAVN